MTPEQFEAKWGEALRAAGYACEVREDDGLYIIGEFQFNEFEPQHMETMAIGLIVSSAAHRRAYIEPSRNLDEDGVQYGWSFRTTDRTLATRMGFDAALIAGCIALAKQEAAK